MEKTAGNTQMTMVIALSYSSRWEIANAMRKMAAQVKEGSLALEQITEETISENLLTSFMPDPDLMIRTGGEYRISNYLLWQSAYTEFYFCDTHWPDFREKDLRNAIADFQQRQRRFGKTGDQVENNE
jgi:undecaprenyl diphosphate synthase